MSGWLDGLDMPERGPQFASAVSVSRLRDTWKRLRPNCKNQLVRDPLDYLAFEWQSEGYLKELRSSLLASRYRPCATTVIRAAKRAGLTRPLQFLDITDSIVIESCTSVLAPKLHAHMADCVFFGRSHKKADDDCDPYEAWFEAWLRRDRRLRGMLADRQLTWIVKADIGNFFPTVSHRLLRQLVAGTTGAEQRLTDLVFFLLEELTWRPDFTQNREIGLPQLSDDASRILAHAFVSQLDEAFSEEVDQGRYARWVDDVVIAVRSHGETFSVLARFEDALSRLGLFPNAAKCRAVHVQDFAAEMSTRENDYLDRVHSFTEGDSAVRPVRRSAFVRRAQAHLQIAPEGRLSTWDRLLRRYYTEARRIESDVLEQHALEHIRDFPETTPKVIDYLRGRPFAGDVMRGLFRYLKSGHNIHHDVEALIWDFICDWRIPTSYASRSGLADRAMNAFLGRGGFRVALTEYARGLMTLCAHKYGTSEHLDEIQVELSRRVAHDPWVMRYGVCALAGSAAHLDAGLRLAARYEDRPLRRIHSLLTSIRAEPGGHSRFLRDHVRPFEKRYPDYSYLPARMLTLVALPRCDESFRGPWDKHLHSVVAKLMDTPEPYRDMRSIDFIRFQLL